MKHPLSPRQDQIMRLAAAGLSNEQIGRRLGIDPRTVSAHVTSAGNRLQVRGRDATIAAWRAARDDAGSGTAVPVHDLSFS